MSLTKVVSVKTLFEPRLGKPCFMPFANNKDADQPTHLRSLISTFVVRCLDSTVSIIAKSKSSRPPSLCSWAGRFESYLVQTPKTGFLVTRPIYYNKYFRLAIETTEPPHDKTDNVAVRPAKIQISLGFRTATTLIRLGGFPGWSESSLGAPAIYVGFVTMRLNRGINNA